MVVGVSGGWKHSVDSRQEVTRRKRERERRGSCSCAFQARYGWMEEERKSVVSVEI